MTGSKRPISIQSSVRSNEPWRRLLAIDPYLKPYAPIIHRRTNKIRTAVAQLTGGNGSISEFAAAHRYFGLHLENGERVFREWAPNATAIFIIGEMTDWREDPRFALDLIDPDGTWELRMPVDTMKHGDLYRLRIHWPGASGDRIPAYARRVVQDPRSLVFNAQVWHPERPYQWRITDFRPSDQPPLIYEAHVGMAQQEARVGTYREFVDEVLPRIVDAGYNTLQLMAIQEHPYYASFGYQVSNYFAASSRFGTPEDLKELVDAAHEAGITVLMDLVHSHAASNEVEGLSRFDGTPYQYFHDGPRGRHPAWDSRIFDYGKTQVLHFLLSNCRFWLEEYHLDGFRFDGITSMLYTHHGLGKAFVHYDDYFDTSVDEDALTYLALANRVVHELRPDAITIAEDVSGMPGLALPEKDGGTGFDYRFSMGVSDNWIRLIKEYRDEDWPLGHLWHELTNRRVAEKTVSYAESHDQALVGDQTLIFRLIGPDIYRHMHEDDSHIRVGRGIALHKMIRFITLATAGDGYLNFMGNEFGHPEWIDFPRPENGWSHHYARRQWHLADAPHLKYRYLAKFDRDMLDLVKKYELLGKPGPRLIHEHIDDKILVFERNGLVFAFNFHPVNSYPAYRITAPAGRYEMVMNSDDAEYHGHDRLEKGHMHVASPPTPEEGEKHRLTLYLPTRTAVVLAPVEKA